MANEITFKSLDKPMDFPSVKDESVDFDKLNTVKKFSDEEYLTFGGICLGDIVKPSI